MNLRIITPPVAEPVSLETAKSHLRVDGTTDDTLIASYLQSAREIGEGLARRAFITQTLQLTLNAWPLVSYPYKLPRPPLQSIESVTYRDQAGTELPWTDYVADITSEPGAIIFRSIPGVSLLESGGISIEFIAGYADETAHLPNVFVQGILELVAYWYENRGAGALGHIPAEIAAIFRSNPGSWF